MPEKAAAVIPARFGSTRFPGKVLADLEGRPLIRWVFEACVGSGLFSRVVLAADDDRVRLAAEAFGAEVFMTDPGHESGTERVAEVAARLDEGIVVNVQGDEPFIGPEVLGPLVETARQEGVEVATPITLVREAGELTDPNVVKVVVAGDGGALYFSRWPVPFHREAWGGRDPWSRVGSPETVPGGLWWRHVGIYAFRRETLLEAVRLPLSPLERLEKLEQLRWLQAGKRIVCVPVVYQALAVDTPEDLERARGLAAKLSK